MPQRLSHTRRARRSLKGLPENVSDQIIGCIDRYNADPTGVQIKKLSGTNPALWSLRCGAYRIIFNISTGDIELIGHRREVYDTIGR